jgi:hypothetical protein
LPFMQAARNFLRSLPCRFLASASAEHAWPSGVIAFFRFDPAAFVAGFAAVGADGAAADGAGAGAAAAGARGAAGAAGAAGGV